VEREEKRLLAAKQPPLGRLHAAHAALIPIKKSVAWWNLPQDERRAIFETQSQHIRIGMDSLPAIARKLHHSRDLSDSEPFDFLTWFEYAAEDAPAFDRLVASLRSTIEWTYVEREVDIRLIRCDAHVP
jgi:chlorite dismutase